MVSTLQQTRFSQNRAIKRYRPSIIHSITTIATTCPTAISCVVTNPVNSTLPVAAETLRKAGVFDPARLFGVTNLDVVRASTFIAHALGDTIDPKTFKVPVIGGHSGATILPLYSQAEPSVGLDGELLGGVIHREFLFTSVIASITADAMSRCAIRWR